MRASSGNYSKSSVLARTNKAPRVLTIPTMKARAAPCRIGLTMTWQKKAFGKTAKTFILHTLIGSIDAYGGNADITLAIDSKTRLLSSTWMT
jgi:hypothetical protein